MSYEIERLGHLGDGVTQDGLFAGRVLPDEIVDGRVDGKTLQDVRIVQPSDHRIKPNCPAYNRCGGCSLHHADAGFVANWKAGVVLRALQAQGITAQLQDMHISPPNSRRRAKLAGRRTKKGAVVGFHGRASHIVQEISGCTVLTPQLLALIPALVEFTSSYGSRKGELGFWVLETKTGIDMAVDGLAMPDAHAISDIAGWAQANGLCRVTVGDEVVAQTDPPVLNISGVNITPPPRAFVQATAQGERTLQTAVMQAVAGAQNVVDLFSGLGTFAIPVAAKAPVLAAEGAGDLLHALQQGMRNAAGLKAITVEKRDLFRNPILLEDLEKFDAAIIDPPRAGAEAQIHHIANSAISTVAMVSCNPVTFARDAFAFKTAGFELNWLNVVDQFRWSAHIEIAAQFTKKVTI